MKGPPAQPRWKTDHELPAGEVLTVHFDGTTVTIWWGRDDDDHERVLVSAGRVRTWPTADACAEDALQEGRVGIDTPELSESSIGRTVFDLQPIHEWLGGRRFSIEAEPALNLWNIAGDIAYSVGAPWKDRSHTADRCHEKLTAACVPRAFGLVTYQPRWSPRELRRLREILGSAINVLRTELA